jgi:hypothetical protein
VSPESNAKQQYRIKMGTDSQRGVAGEPPVTMAMQEVLGVLMT